jgi:uroporphyrinogen-III synthase
MKVISSIAFEPHQIETLEQHHVQLEFIKMMDISFISYDDLAIDFNDIDAPFVFTSQHAAIFVKQLNDLNTQGKLCFAIEGITSELLHKSNFEIISTAKDSEELAKEILTSGYRKIVHITSEWRLPTLELMLANVVDYTAINVYKKVQVPFTVGSFDALVFSSPSHVDSFLINATIPKDTTCICIGDTTEQYLHAHDHQITLKAKSRSKEGLLETILEWAVNNKD